MIKNIRIYGNGNEDSELATNLCDLAGVVPASLMLGKDFKEETAIAICDANYHDIGYPIIFTGSKYLGGVDKLRELLTQKG